MKPVETSALARVGTDDLEARANAMLAVPQGDHLFPVSRPDEATADGYMRLTAHILLQAQRASFRTVGVISALAGEGKTTAAMNLAVCLGRTRGRVGRILLVDADARQRTLSRLLGGGDGADDGRRHPMLLGTAFEGVDLMTAPSGDDGLTLYAPAAWRAALQELAGRYAHVVVDCPPVLDNPEGLVMRECVDELVLVVRAGRTPRRLIERALGNVGRRVLGVILNGVATAPAVRAETWR
jgi:receptor protein-tyrosine kinase